uniref:Predicted protein n=1 Tax=Hordeum vulgare subsp. vulgare TaxID=112509 RepID=F2DMV3_HORVV|nr:predicted protein [Hordeum vulgare subsp. vulgare]
MLRRRDSAAAGARVPRSSPPSRHHHPPPPQQRFLRCSSSTSARHHGTRQPASPSPSTRPMRSTGTRSSPPISTQFIFVSYYYQYRLLACHDARLMGRRDADGILDILRRPLAD